MDASTETHFRLLEHRSRAVADNCLWLSIGTTRTDNEPEFGLTSEVRGLRSDTAHCLSHFARKIRIVHCNQPDISFPYHDYQCHTRYER